jgi:hypothetical protein
VTVSVVDRLETVEVEHQNGHLMRSTGGAETLFKLFLEEMTVGQTGQRVVPRQIACLALRADSCLYFNGEVSISPKPVDRHRDTEDAYHEDDVVGVKAKS